jgi:hypothetical protein
MKVQAKRSPSIVSFQLDSFRPELMTETVSGSMLEHTQLAKGRFLATLLSVDLGESRLDRGITICRC